MDRRSRRRTRHRAIASGRRLTVGMTGTRDGPDPAARSVPSDARRRWEDAGVPVEMLPLIGERVVILHAPSSASSHLRGSDVDCGVVGLDPLWPLRLPADWRLCQYLQYDLNGWFWAIERDGVVVNIDTIDDARGLGRDAFPTTILDGQELFATPSVRAAYLTTKRLRKEISEPGEWERITALARSDPDRYEATLRAVMGPRSSLRVAESVLDGRPPTPDLAADVRRERFRRRFGSPARAVTALVAGAQRRARRLLSPTGFYVLIVGPDGTGKSTLASALPLLLEGTFRRWDRYHWRPGILPRPGGLLGQPESDPRAPHARPPHGPGLSTLLVGYHWLDSLIGGWLRVWPFRARTGLVIVERGWWDAAVDPRRYRLTSRPALVRALGSLLVQPDLVLVLRAPVDVLLERKAEIPRAELERQTAAWPAVFGSRVEVSVVDASRPAPEVADAAREAVLDMLERRAISRLHAGWRALPAASSARWVIPRGPRPTVAASLTLHHPITLRGQAVWHAARMIGSVGGFRLLRRTEAPARPLRKLLAPYIPRGGTIAIARGSHADRCVASIVDRSGRCCAVAKVATSEGAAVVLEEEAASIERFAAGLQAPLAAPVVLDAAPGVLLLAPVSWRPVLRPWRLDSDVANAMGMLFGSHSRGAGAGATGAAHGDWAPWNMLRTEEGWVLIDWEEATDTAAPFFDPCHHLVQSYSLLGRPSLDELVTGFRQENGWIGGALRSYADGANLHGLDPEPFLVSYLERTEGSVRVQRESEARGLDARRALLARLGA